MESAQKCKMHVELAKLHLQQFLSHNSFAECFTEKKNGQHFHNLSAFYHSRVSKSPWYATAMCIDYSGRLYRPLITECWHSKCLATRDICQQETGICKHSRENRLTYGIPAPCRSIPTALAPFSVVIRCLMIQNVVCFSFK